MLFFAHVKCQSLDTFLLTNYCPNVSSDRMTFLPADSEDGQIFICGIFCFLALHVGIFWHLELVVAFFGDFLALHVDIFLAFRIGRGIF